MEKKRKLQPYHGIIGFFIVYSILVFLPPTLHRLFGSNYTIAAEVLIPLSGFLVVLLSRTDIRDVLPFKPSKLRHFFGGLLLFVGVMMLGGSVNVLTSRFIVGFSERGDAISSSVVSMPPLLAIFSIALVPAVCEEIFCRGFVLASMKPIRKLPIIIFIVGFSFGLLHRDLYAMTTTTLMGCLFAYFTLKTDSLVTPIFFHFLNNTMSVVLAYTQKDNISSPLPSSKGELINSIGCSMFYLGISAPLIYFGGCIFERKRPKLVVSLLILAASFFLLRFGLRYISL